VYNVSHQTRVKAVLLLLTAIFG